jgi:hypothetical protein
MEENSTMGWPFNLPLKMILDLAIGGSLAKQKGIDGAAMPQRMKVHCGRVWQVQPRRKS